MAVPITRIDPGQTSGDLLSTSIGSGVGSILQGLAAGKVKELQGRQFQNMGLPSQLAYMDPKVQSSALKQLFAAQQMSQNQPQIQDTLAKLRELEEGGEVGPRAGLSPFRFLGGGPQKSGSDLANMTVEQLKKLLPKGIAVPRNYAKMSDEARREWLQGLEQQFGAPQQQQMAPQQMQQQPEGQPQQDIAGPLGSILRTLGGAATQAPAAILSKVPGIGGPLSAGIMASDLISATEPEHGQRATPEQLAQMSPQQREMHEAIMKTSEETGRLADYLPSTQNIKKLVGTVLPDNIITPKSPEEKLISDAVSKFMNLKSFGNMGWGKTLAATGAGLFGREAAKEAGGGPLAQNTTEFLFTMAPGLLFNNARNVVKSQSNDLYGKFDQSAAARQRVDVKDLLEESRSLRGKASKFESLSSNKQIVKALEDFEKEAAAGKMRLSDAVDAKRELYRIIDETPLDTTAEGQLKGFTKNLRDTIIKRGSKLDADGFQFLKKADEIRTGLANSKTIVNSLHEAAKSGEPKSAYLRTLLSKYPEASLAGVAGQAVGRPFATLALPAAAGKELSQLYKFYKDTPGALEELGKVARDQMRGNTKAAIARLAAVDRKALKHQKKQSRFLTRQ